MILLISKNFFIVLNWEVELIPAEITFFGRSKVLLVKDKNVIGKPKCRNAIKQANKLMGQKGRILVRKSGTEPKIRIMAESYDKSLILKCIKIVKRSIK